VFWDLEVYHVRTSSCHSYVSNLPKSGMLNRKRQYWLLWAIAHEQP
jgi:hypothetical protein